MHDFLVRYEMSVSQMTNHMFRFSYSQFRPVLIHHRVCNTSNTWNAPWWSRHCVPFGPPVFTPVFSSVRVTQFLFFCVGFYR